MLINNRLNHFQQKNPTNTFLIAFLDNQAIGYAKIRSDRTYDEFNGESALEIERIYVLKKFLRMKIGQLLLDHSIKIAKEKNTKFIWLGVWENNEPAIKFYKKNGFQIYGKHHFILGKDVQSDLLMKLNVL